MAGRPATYDPMVFEELCSLIASGETLRGVCRSNDKFPSPSVIREWVIRDEPQGIAERYARARESCIHEMIDDTIEIADDTSRDTKTITGKNGEENDVADTEWIQRSRLRVDTRKWLASKICPKLYGDKMTTEVTGKDGSPIVISWTPSCPTL